MNYLPKVRDALICVVLLAVPFFFLRANLRDPEKSNWVDRLVLQISAPIQYLATQAAWTTSSLFGDYVYLIDVKDEYRQVRRENAQLRRSLRELRSEADENRRLRSLLELRENLDYKTLSAHVVGKKVSPFFRVERIRIDQGTSEGMRKGMPVLSADGLVGQIRRSSLSKHYADVQLVVDRTSKLDIVVQRTGARGVLQGTGELSRYLCRIQYLQREEEIEVGDAVHTSGYGRRFPASILVGYVKKVRRKKFGIHQEVEVEPAVDFSRLREVLVLVEEVNPSEG